MFLNKLKASGMFFLLFCSSMTIGVQAKPVDKQSVLAALTLNLARFTTWPKSESTLLNVCVIGNNVVQTSFSNLNVKTINGKPVYFLNRSRLRPLEHCQVIFFGDLKKNLVRQALMDIAGQNTLTIGEGLEFLKAGGMVGLEQKAGKMQLNINLVAVKKTQLMVSSRILKLATIVEFPAATK